MGFTEREDTNDGRLLSVVHTGQKASKYATRFNNVDCMIAVQWYGRLCESGDGERPEFVKRVEYVL